MARPIKLLTKALLKQLPPLYANESKDLDKSIAYVKFFMPDGGWTWYASEYDGENIFFGLVSGNELELGYFSLTELRSIRGALGLPVERDRFFKPTSLQALMDMHEQRRVA
jgi:hypothetical protein